MNSSDEIRAAIHDYQAGKFEGRSAVSTWLLAITRFKALSTLRRKPDQELDEETAEAIEDTSDTPEVALA